MKISKDMAVSFHFTLTVEGKKIESSFGDEPLVYLHGHNGIVPGLEEALEGQEVGKKMTVTLPPEKAYGNRSEALVQKVPLESFPKDVKAGMQFQTEGPHGPMIITVTDVSGTDVTVDANPEMAGKTLTFDIEVMNVRKATKEELDHGHVHGPGGHHH